MQQRAWPNLNQVRFGEGRAFYDMRPKPMSHQDAQTLPLSAFSTAFEFYTSYLIDALLTYLLGV